MEMQAERSAMMTGLTHDSGIVAAGREHEGDPRLRRQMDLMDHSTGMMASDLAAPDERHQGVSLLVPIVCGGLSVAPSRCPILDCGLRGIGEPPPHQPLASFF